MGWEIGVRWEWDTIHGVALHSGDVQESLLPSTGGR